MFRGGHYWALGLGLSHARAVLGFGGFEVSGVARLSIQAASGLRQR